MLPALTAIGLFWYLLWRSVPHNGGQPDADPLEFDRMPATGADDDDYDKYNGDSDSDSGFNRNEGVYSGDPEIDAGWAEIGREIEGDEAVAFMPLRELFTETQYQPLLEKVLEFADVKTVLRMASLSRYHNSILTSSSVLQLKLRRHYHRLPPIYRRSPYHAMIQRRSPAKKQLADLIQLQEKISTMDPSVQQRLTMSYVDVLCSGDYVIITKALRQRERVEGAPELGFVEDGWIVMVRNGELPVQATRPGYPWERNDNGENEEAARKKRETLTEMDVDVDLDEEHDVEMELSGEAGEWVDEDDAQMSGSDHESTSRIRPDASEGKQKKLRPDEIEGWEQWTVDTQADIADMTVRAEDDLVVVAHVVEDDFCHSKDTIQLHFYHLETYIPESDSSRTGRPIPHVDAACPIINFVHGIHNNIKLRLRAGPKGRLILWVADERDANKSLVMSWDWKAGLELGSAWGPESVGVPHDFGFISHDIILAAVLEELPRPPHSHFNPFTSPNNPMSRPGPTRLALRFFRVPKPSRPAQTPDTLPPAESAEAWTFSSVKACRPLSSFRFPDFTHNYKHKGPLPHDEILPSGTQSFRLGHCSVAAKPAPVALAPVYSSASSTTKPTHTALGTACSGILVVTLEGDFGPVVHPGQPPHDHMSLAFATISVPILVRLMRRRKKDYSFSEWSKAVSWDFGPMNWMTGYGNKTVQVSRWVSSVVAVDENGNPVDDDEDEDVDGNDDDDNAAVNHNHAGPGAAGMNGNAPPFGNGDDGDDAETGYTMLNVIMKDYNPTSIAHRGRTYRGPLGTGQGLPDPTASDPFPPLSDSNDPNSQVPFDQLSAPADLVAALQQLQQMPQFPAPQNQGFLAPNPLFGAIQAAAQGPPVPMPLAPPLVTAANNNFPPGPNQQNHDFFAAMNAQIAQMVAAGPGGNPTLAGLLNMPFPLPQSAHLGSVLNPPRSTSRSISARVVQRKKHGQVYEMFGAYELESQLPYLEVNVNVPVDGRRDGEALENPFKTILCGDKLVVCDDVGFDILSF